MCKTKSNEHTNFLPSRVTLKLKVYKTQVTSINFDPVLSDKPISTLLTDLPINLVPTHAPTNHPIKEQQFLPAGI